MKLTNNFTLEEMTKSNTALRRGIDNTPPKSFIPKLYVLAVSILEPPRVHFNIPFRPSSGYRCVLLNTAVGSTSKQHLNAEAVDFEIPGIDNYELALWMTENTDFDKIILEYYVKGVKSSGWIHASYKSAELNRHQIMHYNGDEYRWGLI